jgi:plastocyanin
MTRTLAAAIALASSVAVAAPPAAAPAPAPAPAAPPPAATKPPDPIAERAQAITEAASQLEKAGAARARGNRNFAEQLFSSAELILGPDALAELAPLFREGAPPRINSQLKVMPKDTPAQPAAVGNSDEEEPEEKPKRGSLTGTLKLGDKPLTSRGVVTLEPLHVKWHARAPRTRIMEQRNRDFAPKMMIVPVGSTVSFPNFDAVYHNVFSRSESRAFDLGIYKNGQSRDVTFDKEGIVRLGCNLHANMSAYIVVVNAPHYAVTDEQGRFSFRSLAPGKYKLRAFSDHSLSPTVQEITIAPDKNSITIAVTADAAPAVDKFGVARGK